MLWLTKKRPEADTVQAQPSPSLGDIKEPLGADTYGVEPFAAAGEHGGNAAERKPDLDLMISGAAARADDQTNADSRPPKSSGIKQQDIPEPVEPPGDPVPVEDMCDVPTEQSGSNKPRGKRKSAERIYQLMTRLTAQERRQVQRRVKESGLPQGEFFRQAVLTSRIEVLEPGEEELRLSDNLAAVRAELGKIGGMLKMIIRPNEGQRELYPEEWRSLIRVLRKLEAEVDQLKDVEVKRHGD